MRNMAMARGRKGEISGLPEGAAVQENKPEFRILNTDQSLGSPRGS